MGHLLSLNMEKNRALKERQTFRMAPCQVVGLIENIVILLCQITASFLVFKPITDFWCYTFSHGHRRKAGRELQNALDRTNGG